MNLGQLAAQLAVIRELGFAENLAAILGHQYRHRRRALIDNQTGVDVLATARLFAVNRQSVPPGLENIEAFVGNINLGVLLQMPLESLDLFAVEINLGVLVMVNLEGQLSRDGVETKIAAQPDIARMPGRPHLRAWCAGSAKAAAPLAPLAVVEGDLEPVVRRFVVSELPPYAFTAVGVRDDPCVLFTLGQAGAQLEFRPALGQAGDEHLLERREAGLQIGFPRLFGRNSLLVSRLIGRIADRHVVAIALAVRRNVAEKREHRVVVLRRYGIDLVVMAAGATDGQAEERLAGGPQNVVEIIVASQLAIRRFVIPNAKPIKAGGRDAVGVAIRKLVASQLLHDETVVRLVLVEGANDVVAVFPHQILPAVPLVPVCLGEANKVEPMPPPLFAIPIRGQQLVDDLLERARRRVGEERLDLRRRRGQAGQVVASPANQHTLSRRGARSQTGLV